MRKFWKKIRDAIICIVVAPAAAIHIAYQVWYFRDTYLRSGTTEPAEPTCNEGDYRNEKGSQT